MGEEGGQISETATMTRGGVGQAGDNNLVKWVIEILVLLVMYRVVETPPACLCSCGVSQSEDRMGCSLSDALVSVN